VAIDGQENHAHAVLARRGQVEAQGGALAGKELMRDLNQHACAVARHRIAARGAAVGQIDQDLDALLNEVVRARAPEAGDESDAAGVAFQSRVVEALGCG
jgi:hypothetical protein